MPRRPLPRWLPLAALALLVAGGLLARRELGVEWDAASVRAVVDDAGLWAPVVFVLLTTFRSLVLIPSQVLLLAAGVCFGALEGALWGGLGITLSGSLGYGLTRWVARDAVLARIPPRMRGLLEAADSRTGGLVLCLGTAYPVGPLTAYHAGAALTGIGIPAFLLALGTGSAVRAGSYTFFGSALVDGGGHTFAIAAAVLGVLALAPLVHPRTRRWLRFQLAPRAAGPAPPEPARTADQSSRTSSS